MIGAIVISATDAASQEAVVGSAQRVVEARARALRDAAVQHCLEHLGSKHPDFEPERSARSVVQFEDVLPEAPPCVAYAPIDLDGRVSIVVDVSLELLIDDCTNRGRCSEGLADRVYCPARAEIENLSANQNHKSRAVCRGNPRFYNPQHHTHTTAACVRHVHITIPLGATTKRQP